jgi:ketosteroid isomerase-like protein
VFTSGADTVHAASNEGMRAFIYGNSAVVIGVLRMKGRGPKGPFDNRYRYTDSWAMIDGQWRCVASQDYLMPAKR